MPMADIAWTVEGLEHLSERVQAVLARHVTVADLPELYVLLAWQQELLERAYRVAGQQQAQLPGPRGRESGAPGSAGALG